MLVIQPCSKKQCLVTQMDESIEKPLDSSSSTGNPEKPGEGKQDTTKEGETESLLAPLPQGSPSKLAPNNRSATLQSNYSSSSKRKTFKKTAINAMLMDAADSDDETPLKYQARSSSIISLTKVFIHFRLN